MTDAYTVQFRRSFNFAFNKYNSLNFYIILKYHISININGDIFQKLSKNSCKLFKSSQLILAWAKIDENKKNTLPYSFNFQMTPKLFYVGQL